MGSKKAHVKVTDLLHAWLSDICLSTNYSQEELQADLPHKWQKHGDIILFPDSSFTHSIWSELPVHQWRALATILKVNRLGIMGKTKSNDFRQPTVRLILGSDGWTEHIDNHVRYCFDVTKTMFSSGNITEKMRVARFDCSGQVVVDLYAGIGYYTLPYLVHAKAAHVHACEWNPDAVAALQKGLQRNAVANRCTVYPGDNAQAGLVDVADRVNLGLLPTSRCGWRTACEALKAGGGFLHIHDCLNTKGKERLQAEEQYGRETTEEINELLTDVKPSTDWECEVKHIERVKSYAPHITHIVLDVLCTPRQLVDGG